MKHQRDAAANKANEAVKGKGRKWVICKRATEDRDAHALDLSHSHSLFFSSLSFSIHITSSHLSTSTPYFSQVSSSRSMKYLSGNLLHTNSEYQY